MIERMENRGLKTNRNRGVYELRYEAIAKTSLE
jgi:hypothetical protein